MSSLTYLTDGSITSPLGFSAAGIHAGLRNEPGRLDLAVIVADEPCTAAGVFTKNKFCAAPVTLSKEHLDIAASGIRGIVINSGSANAATGKQGLEDARDTCLAFAEELGCSETDILIASTGVIGQLLDMRTLKTGMVTALQELTRDVGGHNAARAIMTTDTHPKECAVSFTSEDPDYEGVTCTIAGMAKGSGMIMPDMATMIAVLTTDVPLSPPTAQKALKQAVDASFNKVTVDSDTSTNDTCYLWASGKAAKREIAEDSIIFHEFIQALKEVCVTLARMIATDGEGATKLITVYVTGAQNDEDADKAARAVANSPLVKTAVFGQDANWGRIAMALGKSGASFCQDKVSIDIMGIPVCRNGLTVPFSEDEARRRFKQDEIILFVDLGSGTSETTVWTCDYSHDYITINGDYRT